MIKGIQPLELPLLNGNKGIETVQKEQAPNAILFSEALESASNLIKGVQTLEDESTQLTEDFILGRNENIHNLMIAQEKSSILLQFTTQVRNTALEAYREIMRMSV